MKRSAAAALLALLLCAQPVMAWYDLTPPETTLAYRVRVVRGEATYKLRQWLIDAASVRAVELRSSFSHYCGATPCADRFIPDRCTWGEILAWVGWGTYREASQWAIGAWLKSTGHRTVLLDPRWDAYGTGMVTRRGGGWYMAVLFVDC